MRTIRALMAAAAVVMLPSIASAQQGRGFKDAWFWGLKVGGLSIADSGQKFTQAPTVGLEWLITRTHGGLYVSGSQTFFSQHAFIARDPVSADSGFRAVSLKNLRRVDVALVGFPGQNLKFHPYAGIGLTLNAIADADPEGPFANADQIAFAEEVIQDHKVAFTPLLMGGAQWRLRYASVFGQFMLNPINRDFLLYNGKAWNFGYEFGVRYNIGSAIDRN